MPTRRDDNRQQIVEMVISALANDIERGGKAAEAMRSQYRLNRANGANV